jgi:hypothetical protein
VKRKESEKMDIKNAEIQDTFLGIEDHGIFTASLTLDYGDSGCQGFGQHDLSFRDYGINYLRKILETLEVEQWEDLIGTFVRAKIENGLIVGIGHITKNIWFVPESKKK